MLSDIFEKQRGVRSGLPDVLVLHLVKRARRPIAIFVELKSRRGVASQAQEQVRTEMLPVGAKWWMARSARAATMALVRSGVVFRHE
jgi:hypothetical protein